MLKLCAKNWENENEPKPDKVWGRVQKAKKCVKNLKRVPKLD